MKKNRLISVLLVLSLFVSSFYLIGTDNAYAASKKKTAKNIKVKVVSTSQNTATIKWNKISKPDKGYAVFRNGVVIARFGKKTTSYTDKDLQPGQTYTYQIKTYKTKKVKVKNKKKTKYSYKKKSNTVKARTLYVDVTGIAFDSNDDVYLHVGESVQLNAIVSPSNASNKSVLWYYNSDPSVATVDSNGVVTAKAVGSTFIAAATYDYSYITLVKRVEVLSNDTPTPGSMYINVEKDSYDVAVGETAIIRATSSPGTDGTSGYTISCNPVGCVSVLSRDTGNLSNGEHYEYVTIKGAKAGTASITFSVGESAEVTKTVTVRVTDNVAVDGVEGLHYTIDQAGYINGNGDKTLHHEVSSEIEVFFINHDSSVELVCIQQSDSINAYSTVTIPFTTNPVVTADVTIGSLQYYASLRPSTYTKTTNLTFKNSSGTDAIEAVNNLYNSTFRVAVNSWGLALLLYTGKDLDDLGFTSW